MRSVFAFFHDLDEGTLEASLDELAMRSPGDPATWQFLTEPGDPVLYIFVQRPSNQTFLAEWDLESRRALTDALGGAVTVYVQADVTGRHPGRAEAIQFLIGLLERHEGVATSDYDEDHCWTAAELRADAPLQGRAFFTYPPD